MALASTQAVLVARRGIALAGGLLVDALAWCRIPYIQPLYYIISKTAGDICRCGWCLECYSFRFSFELLSGNSGLVAPIFLCIIGIGKFFGERLGRWIVEVNKCPGDEVVFVKLSKFVKMLSNGFLCSCSFRVLLMPRPRKFDSCDPGFFISFVRVEFGNGFC